MANLQNFKDDFILLCEAGFIAVNQADEDSATKLFKASSLLKPENSLPRVGQGYMHMMKLELKQACNIFSAVLEKEPYNEMARAFLGFSYTLTSTEVAKGEKLLEETVAQGKDDQVKQLAETALDFVDNFIKKAPSPVEKQAPAKKKRKKKE